MFGKQTQSNLIKLKNNLANWVWLSLAIKSIQTLNIVWVQLPNWLKSIKQIKLNGTQDCVCQPNTIRWIKFDCVFMSNFDWTKIMLCGLKNTKNMGYTEVSLEQKNLLLTSTPVLQKIKTQRSKVQFSLIAQLFLWDQCHLVQLPNSVEFSLIEIQFNWVWLTIPGYI